MNKKKNKSEIVKNMIEDYVNESSHKIDPNGSWTGVPEDKREKPIQDADDL